MTRLAARKNIMVSRKASQHHLNFLETYARNLFVYLSSVFSTLILEMLSSKLFQFTVSPVICQSINSFKKSRWCWGNHYWYMDSQHWCSLGMCPLTVPQLTQLVYCKCVDIYRWHYGQWTCQQEVEWCSQNHLKLTIRLWTVQWSLEDIPQHFFPS